MNCINSINKINYQDYKLFFKGDKSLLDKPKIAIVGTRKPNQYSKLITAKLSNLLSNKFVIVSGGAMGIDAIAHSNAKQTIMVSPSGLDVIYPKTNKSLIENIAKNHLIITEYENNYKPRPYSFVQRNRIVVDICEFIIIIEADEKSGSIRSAEFAEKFNKKIYTIPHRIGESKGTTKLVLENKAEFILDIENFINDLDIKQGTEILDFNEALRIYGDKLYEMELDGSVKIENGKVYISH